MKESKEVCLIQVCIHTKAFTTKREARLKQFLQVVTWSQLLRRIPPPAPHSASPLPSGSTSASCGAFLAGDPNLHSWRVWALSHPPGVRVLTSSVEQQPKLPWVVRINHCSQHCNSFLCLLSQRHGEPQVPREGCRVGDSVLVSAGGRSGLSSGCCLLSLREWESKDEKSQRLWESSQKTHLMKDYPQSIQRTLKTQPPENTQPD